MMSFMKLIILGRYQSILAIFGEKVKGRISAIAA
jgi:hypothetical protein